MPGEATLRCSACQVEVDAARLETLIGKPRLVAERSWTGVELDGLIVEELIGAGGMGTVYRARSRRWTRAAGGEVSVAQLGGRARAGGALLALLALLAGLVGSALVVAANGCVHSNCAAGCISTLDLDFDSPIGQPGTYQFTIGSHSCSVVLPTASASCVTIRDFAVVGLHSNEMPTRSLHVTVSKDGVEVIHGDANPVSYGSQDVCGSTCTNARFSMQVPADLVRPFWGPCDQAKLTGTYKVNESHSGSCAASLFSGPTLALESGLLQMNDSACTSRLEAWSPDTCKIQSSASCASTVLGVTWNLTLTDVMGDGSRLLGYGDVAMSTPVTCQGSSNLDLIRQ